MTLSDYYGVGHRMCESLIYKVIDFFPWKIQFLFLEQYMRKILAGVLNRNLVHKILDNISLISENKEEPGIITQREFQ